MKYECDLNGSTSYKGKRIRYRKGENEVEKGALDHVSSCRMITKDQVKTTVIESKDTEKREHPIHEGGGWYLLSNGEKVRGKDKANKAQKELE